MTKDAITTLGIGFALLCILALAGTQRARSESDGITHQLCEEIAHELNNAYVEGLISEADARQIIDNCFDRT